MPFSGSSFKLGQYTRRCHQPITSKNVFLFARDKLEWEWVCIAYIIHLQVSLIYLTAINNSAPDSAHLLRFLCCSLIEIFRLLRLKRMRASKHNILTGNMLCLLISGTASQFFFWFNFCFAFEKHFSTSFVMYIQYVL